jgi:tRNA modification GTPase
MYHTDDTIAAIASAPGGSARGIVRASGPGVPAILRACFHPREPVDLASISAPSVVPGTIVVSSPPAELPAELYLWPTARSYTREKLAELHTIGSPPLVAAVLAALCGAGARLAEPGEFTLRAFLAGRIDLAQAEAVIGVVDAHGPRELQSALAQLAGGLTRPLHRLRESLVELLAHIEAGLDFAEEDIRFITPDEIQRQLDDAAALVEQTALQLDKRARRDSLPSVVLLGWPNTGKSSLFNALAGGGQALVADRPGTTRDYLTFALDLDGVGCQLVDTAGRERFDESADAGDHEIERSAQDLAGAQARDSDAIVLCLDATRPLNEWERDELAANPPQPRLVILTKCDAQRRAEPPCPAIETSAKTGLGLPELRAALRAAIETLDRDHAGRLTADRAGDSLRAAGDALARAAQSNRETAGEELIAGELRAALDELGKVVGTTYTDDILHRIFTRFCIGK